MLYAQIIVDRIIDTRHFPLTVYLIGIWIDIHSQCAGSRGKEDPLQMPVHYGNCDIQSVPRCAACAVRCKFIIVISHDALCSGY